MPLLSETPNRNTLNQRASRARKQEYITSLENKIREHEQRGVHATAEVQNAARQVAEENHMLKDELTVLREHVRCLEDALTRQGVVEILNDEGHVEGTVKGDQGGRVVWRAPSPSSGSGSSSATNKKQKRQMPQYQYPSAVKPENGDDSNQYPSPPDEQVYKESQHDRKRRRTSHDMSSFDEQEAASILLSTATTPVTYEDSSSATSSSYHSGSQNQHYSNDPWRPQQASLVSSNLESSQRYPVAHPHQQQQQRRSSPNSTPCEEAALIIASMRGMHPAAMDGAEMQIMNDLGCDARDGSQRCNVDNVRLFGIMAGESS